MKSFLSCGIDPSAFSGCPRVHQIAEYFFHDIVAAPQWGRYRNKFNERKTGCDNMTYNRVSIKDGQHQRVDYVRQLPTLSGGREWGCFCQGSYHHSSSEGWGACGIQQPWLYKKVTSFCFGKLAHMAKSATVLKITLGKSKSPKCIVSVTSGAQPCTVNLMVRRTMEAPLSRGMNKKDCSADVWTIVFLR